MTVAEFNQKYKEIQRQVRIAQNHSGGPSMTIRTIDQIAKFDLPEMQEADLTEEQANQMYALLGRMTEIYNKAKEELG